MAIYQRNISYLDYLENGMKIKNAGFVRTEESNGQMRLEMRVKNLPDMFSGQYDLHADCGGIIGRISLNRGSGSCCLVWKKEGERRREEVEAGGVYIRLPGRRLVQAVWPAPLRLVVERPEATAGDRPADQNRITAIGDRPMAGGIAADTSPAAQRAEQAELQETRAALSAPEALTPAREMPEELQEMRAAPSVPEPSALACEMPAELQETQAEPSMPEVLEPECGASEDGAAKPVIWLDERTRKEASGGPAPGLWAVTGSEAEPGLVQEAGEAPQEACPGAACAQNRRGGTQEESACYGDKWEQLCHTYPQIHPFEDERVYLSIAPRDFVVLCREYQKMVHNSFLLHGYYNYHHLLLGRIRVNEEWRYYLGVPGNFYTREKMVAEMFGFEAFEGEKNPAAPGDFGYYMKRVEI